MAAATLRQTEGAGDVAACLDRVRYGMMVRGITSLKALGLAFERTDWDGSGSLDRKELDDALRSCGVFTSSQDIGTIFRAFDRDSSGRLDYTEFLRGLKGNLSERRRAMVQRCFAALDRDGSGVVTVDDVRGSFHVKESLIEKKINEMRLARPPAATGAATTTTTTRTFEDWKRATMPSATGEGAAAHTATLRATSRVEVEAEREAAKEAVLWEFLSGFEGSRGDGDGRVTVEEFEDYYADLSASIPSDELFIGILESAWMISEKPKDARETAEASRYEAALKAKIEQHARPTESLEHAARRIMRNYADSSGDGTISLTEFRKFMAAMGISVDRKLVRAIFGTYDHDNSGAISAAEFCREAFGEAA